MIAGVGDSAGPAVEALTCMSAGSAASTTLPGIEASLQGAICGCTVRGGVAFLFSDRLTAAPSLP